MTSPNPALVILRGLLLAGLFGWLVIDLGSRVVAGQDGAGASSGSGLDPGLRVLLRNRDKDVDEHPQLGIFILQDSVLFHPGRPGDLWVQIPSGTRLQILPNVDGFIVTARIFEQELVWPGPRLRLVPAEPLLPPDVDPSTPASELLSALVRSDIEAEDRRPVFMLGNRRFRGALEVDWAGPKSLLAINALPIEAYLEGVLQSEMAASWPLEALKAQAVASRSYAYAKLLAGGQRIDDCPFDVRDTVADQEYRGSGSGGPTIDWAIGHTRGQVLTVFGEPFTPFFHASSGGALASVDEVFPGSTAADGTTPLSSVMPAKADPFCKAGVEALGKDDTHWANEMRYESGELRNLLRGRGDQVGWILRMVAERGPSGRVGELTLGWAGGEVAMSAHAFRQLTLELGDRSQQLKSTLWSDDSPRQDSGAFVIESFGWGHGVGMSQVSAYAMAQIHRYDHQRILEFFYPGAELRTFWR